MMQIERAFWAVILIGLAAAAVLQDTSGKDITVSKDLGILKRASDQTPTDLESIQAMQRLLGGNVDKKIYEVRWENHLPTKGRKARKVVFYKEYNTLDHYQYAYGFSSNATVHRFTGVTTESVNSLLEDYEETGSALWDSLTKFGCKKKTYEVKASGGGG
jgi:hypothetical protein